ncbi:alpha/beta hydrolase [Algoriphagus confluentis]|uniref:Alpha/beta hydrolase-fold protein n=1 Tax=Algoriphagus confluentis TaxID=1697556 RepID=A0ABQ6PQ21_9BACT|nr:alpha/beta hydrolase-fold protein [Algoriphagus confluentis]
MNKSLFLLLFSLAWFPSEIFAQTHSFSSNPPTTVTKEVKNAAGLAYELIITLPPDYQAEKEYPVLYYLDAWWLSELVTGCYRLSSLSNKALANNMLDIILVGISSVGNEKDWNKQRNWDYTPTRYNQNIVFNNGAVPLDQTTTGGAEDFIRFLRTVVFPSVEAEYKTDPASRGILGHSLGGLFGAYVYLQHPDLFSNYILLAPSVWWNNSELLVDKESFISASPAKMYVGMGSDEIKMMKAPMPTFIEYLNQEGNSKLKMTYREYENENHQSVLPRGIYDALVFIYTQADTN